MIFDRHQGFWQGPISTLRALVWDILITNTNMIIFADILLLGTIIVYLPVAVWLKRKKSSAEAKIHVGCNESAFRLTRGGLTSLTLLMISSELRNNWLVVQGDVNNDFLSSVLQELLYT